MEWLVKYTSQFVNNITTLRCTNFSPIASSSLLVMFTTRAHNARKVTVTDHDCMDYISIVYSCKQKICVEIPMVIWRLLTCYQKTHENKISRKMIV